MIEEILKVGIPTDFSRQLSDKELAKLMQSYGLIEQALKDFKEGLITWEEYLELLESHQVNIDSYLGIVDKNLTTIGAN